MISSRPALVAALIAVGAAWGMTQPLAKIAVSQGYRHFGLIFWQLVIGIAVMGLVLTLRRKGLPLTRAALFRYAVIAVIGTVLPNSVSYESARHLPSGLLSMVQSTMPLLAFPLALALGNENFRWMRLAGLSLGLIGVLLIVLPEASLPDPAMAPWVLFAMIAPFFYAMEGNFVAKWGMGGTDPFQLLFGASCIGALIALPLALLTGQFIAPPPPFTAPDLALIGSAVLHLFAYTSYVWLIGRTGPSFAAQVSYLVTGFGVLWAMLIFGDRFSPWVWAALLIMLIGVALVQPRRPRPSDPSIRDVGGLQPCSD